jgi:mono/diheme cytochrome c family protein
VSAARTPGLLAAAALAALAGCDIRWPASMDQQPIEHPLDVARLAPPGAIPVGGVETVLDRDDVEDSTPPAPFDEGGVSRGRALFATFCVPCHGKEGRGDGPVSAKFPPAPNLRHISICKRSDGYIYGTLTVGGKAMPTMREGTTSRNRWDLVAFVRSLQAEGCTGTMTDPVGGTATPGGAK